ncbi:hypothetical protein C2E23DRAFT_592757 [Lenzites betulinus]|nr:hypothetical protein C2E23DRAFT_592757 [Lenzites betulinus]
MTTLLAPIAEQNVGPAPVIDDDVEPDAQWKEALRSRIERGLQSMVDKVRQERDSGLRGLREGTYEYEAVMRTYHASMDHVRRIAEDQFSQELKIARFERSLEQGKEVEGEEFAAFRREQQAIWDKIKKDGAERPPGRQGPAVVEGPPGQNGEPTSEPARASVARAPGPEYRPRDRTQSGGSDQVGGVPGSYGSRPARSRGNSSVLAADLELPSPGPSPYDQSSIGRQGLSTLSRTRPQDIWLPAQSPIIKENGSATSRTFAHAASPGIPPVSPNVREGPSNDGPGRTASRAGSIRLNERPSPLGDYDASSSLPRDRFGMGSLEDRMSSRKGKEPDRSEQMSPQPTTPYEYYAPRRADSRAAMPITPVRPSLPAQSDDTYFYQASPVSARPRPDSEDREGIPVRKRSTRRSINSDQSSPENPRYIPPSSAAARPIPNKRSFNGAEYDNWPPQSGMFFGPQSPPASYATSNSRPIPRPSTNDDNPRRHSPSGPWHGSQSPPDAFPFSGHDLPFSSSPRPRYNTGSSVGSAGGGGGGGGGGRRNSNGSRSVRSRSSRQEFWGPADVSQRPLATYEEQSVASDSESEKDYGMDLDNLWRVRERQELAWTLAKEQEAAKKAKEAERLQEEARRKEEEARKKEEEAKRQAEEARRKEEEVRLRALEIQQKEEELRRREAELLQRELEAKFKEERRLREEVEARLQEEIRRRQEAEEEAKRREEAETRRRQREEAERREMEEAEKRRQEREESERIRTRGPGET